MPDLYIIGAGCSKNYSQATHQIKGLESPLNRDFFKMAYRVIENTGMKSDSLFMEEVRNLIVKITPLYGSHEKDTSFFKNQSLNLEDVMTLLDIDSKLFLPFTDPQTRLTESSELHALKELLVRTLDYALKGPPCRKHALLAEKMQQGDVVLSFNYDLLMDNALYSLGKMTDYGYHMNFFKVSNDGQWIRTSESFSEITLLKLHGSLNWIRCGFCGALLLYRFQKQTLIGAQGFRCPRCSSEEPYARRMIIPPVQSKDYGDRDVAFLWILADQLLKEFSRIICIGYSFPPSDFDMISLMRRFRARQDHVQEVIFVSPDSGAKKRLEKLLGKETNHFQYLSDYLRHARNNETEQNPTSI
jgi:hypothetical protein